MIKHIIKTQSFDQEFLSNLFNKARSLRDVADKEINDNLLGKIVAMLFYEPSTRTRFSFTSAVLRQGGTIITTENASQFSSAAKGESLEDSIRVISKYCDCIVLRHKEAGAAARAAHVSTVPIISAGDGSLQHPTQSLLDLFTIEDELGTLNGITVLLSGDLKFSRTIHSLAYLLGKFEAVRLFLASPPGLEAPQDILSYLKKHNVEYFQFDSIESAICADKVDVVYHTRPQKERYRLNDTFISYEECKDNFTITRDLADKMHADAIILHPLPRIDEITPEVDNNHRAKYFKQAENGLYVRMALLNTLLGK